MRRGNTIFRACYLHCHGEKTIGAPHNNVVRGDVSASLANVELKKQTFEGDIQLRIPPYEKTLTEKELNDLIAYSWPAEKKGKFYFKIFLSHQIS